MMSGLYFDILYQSLFIPNSIKWPMSPNDLAPSNSLTSSLTTTRPVHRAPGTRTLELIFG